MTNHPNRSRWRIITTDPSMSVSGTLKHYWTPAGWVSTKILAHPFYSANGAAVQLALCEAHNPELKNLELERFVE